MLFELNCGYHPRILYKEDVNPHFQSKLVDKPSVELRELIIVCQENLYYTQKLQKRVHNKGVKLWSYAFGEKVWLNSKYIKTKRNQNLEAKFFELIRVLYSVRK